MTEDKEDPDAKMRNGNDKGIVGCYKQKAETTTKQELHNETL